MRLSGGRRCEVDVVLAATGYARNVERLVGHLGVLRSDGHPQVHGSQQHPDAPGLYFVGFTEPFSVAFGPTIPVGGCVTTIGFGRVTVVKPTSAP